MTKLSDVSVPVVSLTVIEEDGENQLDLPVESHEKEVSDNIALRQVLLTLDSKDRKLIELRYYKNLTQSATANMLDMSQVQVSRREKKILEYIRKKLE